MDIEKLKGEPKRAFEQFQKYLKLPKPRKIEQLASDEKNFQLLCGYYKKWDWEQRARLFDSFAHKNDIFVEEITIAELNKKLSNELKNFSWIFADAIKIMSKNLSDVVGGNNEIDIDAFSKQISLILKNLQDFLKIKEFLQESQSEDLNIAEMIFEQEKVKNALFDLKNLILEEVEKKGVENFQL